VWFQTLEGQVLDYVKAGEDLVTKYPISFPGEEKGGGRTAKTTEMGNNKAANSGRACFYSPWLGARHFSSQVWP